MKKSPGKLFVIIGLPGSGKTTRAKKLAEQHAAIRLTPDEWMIPLFEHNIANRMRDVIEGRFVWLASGALANSINVVLDFGVWSTDERSAIKYLAAKVGADCELVYMTIDHDEQLRRIQQRFATAPNTIFPITEDDLVKWRSQFHEPDQEELQDPEPGPPPQGCTSWEAWTTSRWPTSAT